MGHRRLPRALVRRLPGAEPRRYLRTLPQCRRAAGVLAGAAGAIWADGLDYRAHAARPRVREKAPAPARRHRRIVGAHDAALADLDPAHRHFLWARHTGALSFAIAQRNA